MSSYQRTFIPNSPQSAITLTPRAQIAAMAMQGILSTRSQDGEMNEGWGEHVADAAIYAADALIAALQKSKAVA